MGLFDKIKKVFQTTEKEEKDEVKESVKVYEKGLTKTRENFVSRLVDLTKNYKSFANFDENKFAYTENNDGSYKVENDEFISLLASIINSNTTNFLTYIASVNITMSEGTISIKGSTLMYGSFTFEILNVGSTTLEDIVL